MTSTSTATTERPASNAGAEAPIAFGGKKGRIGRIVAGSLVGSIRLAITLSACGSTATGRPATAPSTVASTVAGAGPRTTTVVSPSLLPEPTGTQPIGVRTIPAVTPAATTRVWYPARPGTGRGAPIYLADKTAAAYALPADQLRNAGALRPLRRTIAETKYP